MSTADRPLPDHRNHDGRHDPHDHRPHHAHDHSAGASRGRLALVLALTSTVLVAEVVTGLLTGSLALLADAGHMLTDAIGLVIALTAAHLSTRPPTDRSTWGMRRAEVIGAPSRPGCSPSSGSSSACARSSTSSRRARSGPTACFVMGVIGLAANVVSMLVLASGRGSSLNTRAAFLEVANDALGSVGVIVAAGVVALTGWTRADAIASLLIVALIFPRALSLLRSAGRVLMDFTPETLDLARCAATSWTSTTSRTSTTCTPGRSPPACRC